MSGFDAVRILLIDDHTLFREAIGHVLSGLDDPPIVIEAATAEEAIHLAEHYKDFDLIMLDLSMPGMGGLAGLPRLGELAPTAPVVVVSGHDDADTVRKAIDAGAAGYIPKTSSARDLATALRVVLSGEIYIPPDMLPILDPQHRDISAARPPAEKNAIDTTLTARQLEVLALLSDGKPNKVIAHELGVSEGTIKLHLNAIFRALKTRNRTEAVVEAARRGLIPASREPD